MTNECRLQLRGSRGIGDKSAIRIPFSSPRGNRQSHLGLPTRQSQCAGATLLPQRPTSLEIGMEGETFLWLIRHAPVYGAKGTIHAADAPADGDRVQLEALRHRFRQMPRAWRARRDVRLRRRARWELEPALVPEFSEQDFGDWTGLRHDELAATGGEAYAQFWSNPARGRPPGGESFEDQVARVRLGLAQIGAGSATLVVHSGTIRAALCIALDLTPTSGPALRDRSVVTDPDRPARHRLARRRGQSARGLSWIRPGDPARWPARRSPCRCEGCTRAAPAAARWRHPILRRA